MSGSAPQNPLRVDAANQCIWRGHQRVELAAKAFLVLRCLMQRPNQIVTKKDLLDAVWPDTYVMEGVLKVAINQLRAALGDNSQQPRFIETVHRRGYRWIGPREAPGASPNTATAALSPVLSSTAPLFVGRQSALAQLQQALAWAAGGNRQMVFVTGEPGIGKTALVDEFLRGSTPYLLASGQCADGFGTSDAYMPLLQALTRLCRSSPSADVAGRLRRLAPTWLVQLPHLLDAAERDDLRRSLAGSSSERMIYELLCFVEDLTVDQTLLVLLEDLHWSDHATIGALAALATRREPAHLMIVASYRPSDAIAQLHPITRLKHELISKKQCQEIALEGLEPEGVEAYLSGRFGNHRLPAELPALLQGQTSGNPLFMLNAVEDWLQRGWLAQRDGNWQCTVDLATLAGAVPVGSREMIGFRLQQLSVADHELLEGASVIGASFTTQALAAVLGRESAAVEVDCARLVRSAQFLGEGQNVTWPDSSRGRQHAFSHTLYRQVLYTGVTPARCQLLHRRVAECLEKGFAQEANTIAPQLAHHFELGGDLHRAVHYRCEAAREALNRFAYSQAVAHLRAGLGILRGLPPSAERDALELALQADLLIPMYADVGGNSRTDMDDVIERIDMLSQGGGPTTPELFRALATLVSVHATRGAMSAARSVSERLVELAPEGLLATIASGILGFCQLMQGEIAAAMPRLEESSGLPELLGPLDPGIVAAGDLALGRCLLGDANQAREQLASAMRRAAAAKHPATLVHVAFGGIRIGIILLDHNLVEESAAISVSLQPQFHERWQAWLEIAEGWREIHRGNAGGAERIQRARQKLFGMGVRGFQSLFAAMAATGHLRAGRYDQANALLQDGLVLIQETGESWCESELHRLGGELKLALAQQQRRATKGWQQLVGEAEACLHRALEVARAQGGRWWQLRAAVSLARLLDECGRRAEARLLLRDEYGGFHQGFDLPDLRAAQQLLESLSD